MEKIKNQGKNENLEKIENPEKNGKIKNQGKNRKSGKIENW